MVIEKLIILTFLNNSWNKQIVFLPGHKYLTISSEAFNFFVNVFISLSLVILYFSFSLIRSEFFFFKESSDFVTSSIFLVILLIFSSFSSEHTTTNKTCKIVVTTYLSLISNTNYLYKYSWNLC